MKNKLFLKNGHYYQLSQNSEGEHQCSPVGGGFVYNIKDISALEFVKVIPDTVQETEFFIEDSPKFKGYHNPHQRWNGWAMPQFSRNVVENEIIPWLEEFLGTGTIKKLDNGNYEIPNVDYPEDPELIEFDDNDFAGVGSGYYVWEAVKPMI